MNDLITDAIDATNKLLSIFQNSLGYIFEPGLITRKLKAEARGLVKAEQEKIIGIEKIEKLLEKSKIPPELCSHLMNQSIARFGFNLLNEQININQITEETYHELEGKKVTDEPINEDWIKRFFGNAKDISDEELQKIWALILAGEIKQPKSFNLRLLDILHNITKSEIELFNKFAQFSWDGSLLAYNQKFFEENLKITFGDNLLLDDVGLTKIDMKIATIFHFKSNKHIFDFNKKCMIIEFPDDTSRKISIPVIKFTSVGAQLSKLVDKNYPDEYLFHIGKTFKKYIGNCSINLYDIKGRDGDEMIYNRISEKRID